MAQPDQEFTPLDTPRLQLAWTQDMQKSRWAVTNSLVFRYVSSFLKIGPVCDNKENVLEEVK